MIDTEKEIKRVQSALAKTTSEKLKRDYNKYLKKLLRSVKCNKEFTGAKE